MVADPDKDCEKKAEKAAVLMALAAETGKAAGPCLAAEEMAALVDGRVKAPALAVYLAHLGSCGKCYEEWLFLKKERTLSTPRRRVYALRRIKKFSYIGSALAVAASIAVYLNVGNMADKTLEQAVPGAALIQDHAVAPVPQRPAVEKSEKDQAPPATGQNIAGSAAVPAAPARIREQAKGRLEARPAAPAGSELLWEQRAKRLAGLPPDAGTAQPEGLVAKEAESTPAERSAAPAAPPGAADMAGWLVQLREACLADRHGAEFWAEMIDRGERLRPIGSTTPADKQRRRITTLLALLREMRDPVSETGQCRLILAELAKDGGTQ